MFTSKSFNLSSISGILNRSKSDSRTSSVLEPSEEPTVSLQQQIRQLQQQNFELKSQLEKLKEHFIETRIGHDNRVREYEEMIEQLRNQLAQKDAWIERYVEAMHESGEGNCPKIQQEPEYEHQTQPQPEKQQEEKEQNHYRMPEILTGQYRQAQTQPQASMPSPNQVSELMLQSGTNFKEKYETSRKELQTLKNTYQKLKLQLENQSQSQNQNLTEKLNQNPTQKTTSNTFNTIDASIIQPNHSHLSFDFLDIANSLKDVDQIAHFSHNPSHITVDQQQISVRDQRIQNLERHNLELQHQLASKSHKLARIFNAAYQFGGMHLLDYIQNSIGLIESKLEENTDDID